MINFTDATSPSGHRGRTGLRKAAALTLSGLVAASGVTLLAPSTATAASKPADVELVQATLEPLQTPSTDPTTVTDPTTTTDPTTVTDPTAPVQRTIKLTWESASGASYYRVYVSDKQDSGYKRSGGNYKTTSAEVNADQGKVVYLKVRAFKGSKHSAYSYPVSCSTASDTDNATKVTLSQDSAKLYIRHTVKLTATADGTLSENTPIRWYSADTSIAKVSSSGKVTAKKKGTAKIYAIAHNGVTGEATITVTGYKKVKVPNVVGMKRADAEQALDDAGLTGHIKRTDFFSSSKLKKNYAGHSFTDVLKQYTKSGRKVNEFSTVNLYIVDKIPYEGTGVEAMVRWAEDIANDYRFGYSMGVTVGRVNDRYDPFLVKGASLDYDCATFVNAALAHSGMGSAYVRASQHPPVVSGVVTLMLANGWKRVTANGKKPSVSKLKRGDILVNPSYHIEIYDGDKQDVGAHYDYDGKSGDSSGEEVNIRPTSKFPHGYTAVYRYYGSIENDLVDED